MAVALFEQEVYVGDLCLNCLAKHLGSGTGQPRRPADQVNARLGQPVAEIRRDHERPPSEGKPWRRGIRAGQIGALADRIDAMETCGVTLAAVQQAEKDTLHKLFPGLREEDLCRLVDNRYREVLWRPT
jgi:hypothetical protein